MLFQVNSAIGRENCSVQEPYLKMILWKNRSAIWSIAMARELIRRGLGRRERRIWSLFPRFSVLSQKPCEEIKM